MQLDELSRSGGTASRRDSVSVDHCVRVCMAAGCQSSGAGEVLEGLRQATTADADAR